MSFAIRDFFANGGRRAIVVRIDGNEHGSWTHFGKGFDALDNIDSVNLLCIPPVSFAADIEQHVWVEAAEYCEKRGSLLLVDPPLTWTSVAHARAGLLSALLPASANAALYFPRLHQRNAPNGNPVESFVPCGAVAGIIARTDERRGVWKSPAGLDTTIHGIESLSLSLTDEDNAQLSALGVNCIRSMPRVGHVIWGARTLQDRRLGSEWRYLPVRRTALFMEESLSKGLQWTVFEPNNEPLWGRIRNSTEIFLHSLFLKGAFQGRVAKEAYFVRCDSTTTTQADMASGRVDLQIGFAPLKPAEFVVLKLSLQAKTP